MPISLNRLLTHLPKAKIMSKISLHYWERHGWRIWLRNTGRMCFLVVNQLISYADSLTIWIGQSSTHPSLHTRVTGDLEEHLHPEPFALEGKRSWSEHKMKCCSIIPAWTHCILQSPYINGDPVAETKRWNNQKLLKWVREKCPL